MGSAGLCARFHKAVELIGRRWSGAIIQILLNGPARYAELRSAIPDITDRMLSERLRELEDETIVARTVVPETPVRVEVLTDLEGPRPGARARGDRALGGEVGRLRQRAGQGRTRRGGAVSPSRRPRQAPSRLLSPRSLTAAPCARQRDRSFQLVPALKSPSWCPGRFRITIRTCEIPFLGVCSADC